MNITMRIAAVAAILMVVVWQCLLGAFEPHGLEEEKQSRELLLDLDFKSVETKDPSVGMGFPIATDGPGFSPPQPHSTLNALLPGALMQYQETSHDEKEICIAVVDDDSVMSSAVINENGYLHLALPESHDTFSTVQCTSYGNDPRGLTGEKYNAPAIYKPPPSCDRKHFQPGYYNKQLHTWNDFCSGRVTELDGLSKGQGVEMLSNGKCPIGERGKDVWVSFIGDSVVRDFFQSLFGKRKSFRHSSWRPAFYMESNPYRTKSRRPDLILVGIDNSDHWTWLSFSLNYIFPTSRSNMYDVTYSWGDFVRQRSTGPHPKDPQWPNDRIPDIVFYSPGYHATELNSTTYGTALEGFLRAWQDEINGYHAPMPAMHLMLNMMPAPWLIPDSYAWDRDYRTLLNEYQKNLAIIGTARKFDFVRSVVDVFSVELPFNGVPGLTEHRDAVHIGKDSKTIRIAGDRILHTLCHSL